MLQVKSWPAYKKASKGKVNRQGLLSAHPAIKATTLQHQRLWEDLSVHQSAMWRGCRVLCLPRSPPSSHTSFFSVNLAQLLFWMEMIEMHNHSSGVRPSKVGSLWGAETQRHVDINDLQWPLSKQNTGFSWDRSVHGLLEVRFGKVFFHWVLRHERNQRIRMKLRWYFEDFLSCSRDKFHHFLL